MSEKKIEKDSLAANSALIAQLLVLHGLPGFGLLPKPSFFLPCLLSLMSVIQMYNADTKQHLHRHDCKKKAGNNLMNDQDLHMLRPGT